MPDINRKTPVTTSPRTYTTPGGTILKNRTAPQSKNEARKQLAL